MNNHTIHGLKDYHVIASRLTSCGRMMTIMPLRSDIQLKFLRHSPRDGLSIKN